MKAPSHLTATLYGFNIVEFEWNNSSTRYTSLNFTYKDALNAAATTTSLQVDASKRKTKIGPMLSNTVNVFTVSYGNPSPAQFSIAIPFYIIAHSAGSSSLGESSLILRHSDNQFVQ